MQLMPGTAAQLGVTDSFRADQNINGGTAYLDALLLRYHDHLALALAAYNAGPAAVDKYHGVPPYRETRVYVARVIREFNRRKQWEKLHPAGTAALVHAMPTSNHSTDRVALESQVKKHSWIMYLVGAILLGALVWLVHTAGPLSVERFSRPVAACGLAPHRFRRGHGAVLLLAARGALGSADQAAEEGQLALPCWARRSLALPRWRSSAAWRIWCVLILSRKRTRLPLSSQIAVYTVERMFDLGAMALIFSGALVAGAGPRHAAPSRSPAARRVGRPGGRHRSGHLRRQRACFRQSGCRLGGKSPRLAFRPRSGIGGNQDSRLSRRTRFHRHAG